MLRRISSDELTEWAVFERRNGPLGDTYSNMVLREIHFALKELTYVFVSANTEENKQNPLPEPERLPGPHEFVNEDDEDDEEE